MMDPNKQLEELVEKTKPPLMRSSNEKEEDDLICPNCLRPFGKKLLASLTPEQQNSDQFIHCEHCHQRIGVAGIILQACRERWKNAERYDHENCLENMQKAAHA